jgi:hypothetical protein
MEESGSSMRPTPHLGELSIKVPAPFAGISDLGFTAQYRAQQFNEPQRDVPLLFEGPASPVERLATILQMLSGSSAKSYTWTDPVLLADGVVVLAFRDRSVRGHELSDGARLADYVLNLVRPVVFTFLHDCAAVAHLRLSDVIAMRVSANEQALAEFALPLDGIVRPNGERLLWNVAS